ncbi:MAG: hypothetical protein IJD85_07025, partial [Oscillospiraceae bacterium]|nr:hypothetical protein [Oscillospiraceae bacterium]
MSFSLSLVVMGSTITYAEKACDDTVVNNSFPVPIQEIVDEYVNAFPELEEEIVGTVEIVTDMPSYIETYNQDEDTAYELLRSSLNNLVCHSDISTTYTTAYSRGAISTYGANYRGYFYANHIVPVVMQSTGYNCGIAAALQAAIGNGFLDDEDENKDAKKMTELAGYINYNEKSKKGVRAGKVRDIMNHYKDDTYDAIPITIYNIDSILYDMEYSFIKGYCPIITLTDTSQLSYYQGRSYNHWVTVSQIDDIHHTVTLVDPFNPKLCNGLSSFGGTHV